jgi:hypothetical protein
LLLIEVAKLKRTTTDPKTHELLLQTNIQSAWPIMWKISRELRSQLSQLVRLIGFSCCLTV